MQSSFSPFFLGSATASVPEITDDDIDWVCSVMGLDAFDEPRRAYLKRRTAVDVSACSGSGKTTLIVAKLAILARKWPHRTKGICVLSHMSGRTTASILGNASGLHREFVATEMKGVRLELLRQTPETRLLPVLRL
jgi:hypothetical protein